MSEETVSYGAGGGAGRPELLALPEQMRAWSRARHGEGRRIALVPTMGALHAGHVALLEAARAEADAVVMSLFVNPTQFGPGEDLSRYPRDLEGDLEKAARARVDVVFAPTPEVMYPEGFATSIDPGPIASGLCGARRPGHFRGVATVVTKLFGIVEPDMAVFGEKDYQQLLVIRRVTADLNLPVRVLSHPTVREPDGLAMSSRNAYLSADERRRAIGLRQALRAAQARYLGGELRVEELIRAATEVLVRAADSIDYLEVRDVVSLAPMGLVERPAIILGAALFGGARLIDNLKLSDES